jgi:1-acyl-sn-glycerol-3-phosphate acyltransferase
VISRPLVALGRFLAAMWLFLFFRLEVSGLDNLRGQGAVIAAKHRRWEDIPILALALPCDLHFLAKVELFAGPLKGRLMEALGGIPINRARPMESRGSLRRLADVLSRGGHVVVFPEGTYFRHSMGMGKEGALRFLVSRLDCTVVPVGIEYVKGPLRTTAVVKVGRPMGRSAPARQFPARVMAEIAALSGF